MVRSSTPAPGVELGENTATVASFAARGVGYSSGRRPPDALQFGAAGRALPRIIRDWGVALRAVHVRGVWLAVSSSMPRNAASVAKDIPSRFRARHIL